MPSARRGSRHQSRLAFAETAVLDGGRAASNVGSLATCEARVRICEGQRKNGALARRTLMRLCAT